MEQVAGEKNAGFREWVLDLITSMGAEPQIEDDPAGFQFEADGRIARVLPHDDPSSAVIEVEVLSLLRVSSSLIARASSELMRLNHDARFSHEWQAALDDDDMLVIWSKISTSETDLHEMADLLAEGIERAATLSRIVEDILSIHSPSSNPTQPSVMAQIRG